MSSVEHRRAGPSSNVLVRLQARWASCNDATPTASSQIFARVRRAYVEPAWRRTSSHGGWQAGTADIDLAEPPLSSLGARRTGTSMANAASPPLSKPRLLQARLSAGKYAKRRPSVLARGQTGTRELPSELGGGEARLAAAWRTCPRIIELCGLQASTASNKRPCADARRACRRASWHIFLQERRAFCELAHRSASLLIVCRGRLSFAELADRFLRTLVVGRWRL